MCPTPSRWCGRPLTFYRSNGGTPHKLYAVRVNLSRSATNRRRGKSAGRPRRPLYGHDRLSFRRGRRPAVERSGTNALGVRRPVPCHSEPVRAAKQVPLGYRLAWESVSLQGRTTLSAHVTGAGIRFFVLGRTDCRVASLLAMTECVGDGVLDVPPRRGGRLCPPSPANAQKDRLRRSFQRLSLNPSI